MRVAKKRLLILMLVIGLSLTLLIPVLNRTSAQSVVAVIPMTLSAQGVAVDATRNRIFVIQVNSSGNPGFEVVAINGVTNSILATIPVAGFLGQYGIAVNEVTGRVYVANGFGLVVIDADTFSILSTISLPFKTTSVAVNPATNRVYANASFTQLKVIDGATEAVLSTIFLSSIIWDLEVDPVRNRIYATHESAGAFSVINGASNSLLTTVPISGRILAMAVDPSLGQLYFADTTLPPTPGRLFVVDSTTHATLATLTIDTRVEGVGVDTSTHRVYVGTGTLPFTVTVIDGLMRSLVTTIGAPVPVGHPVGVNRLTHRAYFLYGGPEPSSRVVVLADPPPIITPPSCVPPPAGMISWWTGDGNANDLIGSNHGTLQNGASFAPGIVGQAFQFNGIESRVETPDSPTLHFGTSDITIDAWIKAPPAATHRNILGKESQSYPHPSIIFNLNDQGRLQFAVTDCGTGSCGWTAPGDGGSRQAVQSPMRVDDDFFHHVAGIRRPSGYELYVDGQLVATRVEPARNSDNSAPLFIGIQAIAVSGAVISPFNGLIEEVEIFNRALSASEIQAIYNAGSAGKCKNQAPVALCQNITVAADANCTATAVINNGSYDPDGDALTITQSPAGPYPLGNTLVTLTVTDSKGASSQCTATVTVVDNTAPAITLNGANPMTVECHTGFSDPGATALDNCAGTVVVTTSGSVNPNVPGSYTLTYAATDGTNSASATRTVNVVDTTAPGFTLKSSLTLWPPNHKYTTVSTAQMVQSVSDSCATLSLSQVVIEQVTSDEPDNGLGDGDTANDIVIASDCKSVQLRAERAGGGNGRVYSVRLRVQDGHGNSTSQEFKVTVPLNQNGAPAVEDAPVSTKTCGGGSAVLTPGGTLKPAVTGDFDGDRQTDFAVWRGLQGAWLVQASTHNLLDLPLWGASYAPYHDVLAAGDYDGDGKADQAVYRRSNGTFYVKGSANGVVSTLALGSGQDEPVPGDYDGDGRTDFAVWQAASGTWLLQRSGGQRLALQWGSGVAPYFDVPVPADFDGDGQTDLAVYRRSTGTWYIRRSSDGGVVIQAWGLATDVPVPGDYDGDGKTDFAVWRGSEGNWYVRRSTDNQYQVTAWGAERVGDVPVPGDYDGDGKTDWAVWRVPEGKWYVRFSGSNTIRIHSHGQIGDTPVSSCRLP